MDELSSFWWEAVAIGVLLFLSAAFSATETALFSLSRTQVRRLAEETGAVERAIADLLHDTSRLLSTILVGNMVVNILIASLVATLARHFFADRGTGIAIGVSTGLLLIFGEVTPKVVASRHAMLVARGVALPIRWLSVGLAPIRWGLRWILGRLMILLGQRDVPAWGMLTREEIVSMVAMGQASGATSEKERELAVNILELPLIDARDLMVPRTEMKGVPDSLSVAEAYALACSHRHSRMPVYHEDMDDIWGFIVVTDLPRWRGTPVLARRLGEFRNPGRTEPLHGESPVRPVHVFPENARVEKLLTEMRHHQAQLVILVDEYGGTAGMLTQQDILAEILGQFAPGQVDDVPKIEWTDGSLLVDGQVPVRDLNRRLPQSITPEAADTIGGYLMERLGRLPRAGDVVADDFYRYQVIKMAGRRIAAVRLEQSNGTPWTEEPGL